MECGTTCNVRGVCTAGGWHGLRGTRPGAKHRVQLRMAIVTACPYVWEVVLAFVLGVALCGKESVNSGAGGGGGRRSKDGGQELSTHLISDWEEVLRECVVQINGVMPCVRVRHNEGGGGGGARGGYLRGAAPPLVTSLPWVVRFGADPAELTKSMLLSPSIPCPP